LALVHHRLSKRFFQLLGALLGILFGFWMGATVGTEMELLARPFQILAYLMALGLVYFVLQLSLATVFKQPTTSRSIYAGMWTMPLSWLASLLFFYPAVGPDAPVVLLSLFLALTLVPVTVFSFASFSVYLLTGIDTCELPRTTQFGYTIVRLSQSSLDMLRSILDRAGLIVARTILPKSHLPIAGYISATKGPLYLRASYFESSNTTNLVLVLHEVVHESVREVRQNDDVLDLQAEIDGLLRSWKARAKIKSYSFESASQIQANLLTETLQAVEAELGPRRVSLGDIKNDIRSYPSKHPTQFALLLAVISSAITAVISVVLSGLLLHPR